jgi:hypothetical protein
MHGLAGSHRTERRPGRTLIASMALAASLGGMTACSDSAGPESGEVTTEDLQEIQDDFAELEDRVVTLEDMDPPDDPAADEAASGGEMTDEEKAELIGQEVTVSAEVSELITDSDVGTAFRIAGESGPSVAVLATTPPEGLDQDDVVRISGTITMISRDSFEDDFGIAEDDLFDDPDGFFDESEGDIAIAATEVEVLQEQADE